MKWEDILNTVGNEPVFSSALLMAGNRSRQNILLQLSRWTKTGKLIQLRRGLYLPARPYRKVIPHPFLLANKIKKASYVSLQSALAYYGMIPENVPVVTSVTTMRPEKVDTDEGTFSFRHVKKSFFNGYCSLEIVEGQTIFIATPEKSLLDLIYLTPGGETFEYLRELRLQNTDRLDLNSLRELAKKAGSTKLGLAVKQVIKIIGEEEYKDL